jgi:hypothetical protein
MANFSIYSVHVNWPGGYEGVDWPTFDPTGYGEAVKSMAEYGRGSFSEGFLNPLIPI